MSITKPSWSPDLDRGVKTPWYRGEMDAPEGKLGAVYDFSFVSVWR